MKTKIFILLFLFLGVGTNYLAAQFTVPPPPDNKTQTGSIPMLIYYDYWIPIYDEDGNYLDELYGPGTVHMIFRYHKGNLIAMDYVWKGDGLRYVNGTSEEVFKIMDVGKQEVYNNEATLGFSYFKVNIIGNLGTHIRLDATFDWETMTYSWGDYIWLGNKY